MSKTATSSVKTKALALTGAFEGAGKAPTGNFDQQLLSWGPLQWNLGQKTLQPILYNIARNSPDEFKQTMGEDFFEAVSRWNITNFVKARMLDESGNLAPEWEKRFVLLYDLGETQRQFERAAKAYLDRGERLCEELGFETERGYALCFDIAVQNGAPRHDHIESYRRRIAEKQYEDAPEWIKLKELAYAVAGRANHRWQQDVLSRKVTIAVGAGTVHGQFYDLEHDFGISYDRTWWKPEWPCGISRVFLDGQELDVAKIGLVGNKLYVNTKR